jgi:uncharacterized protein DUF6011
MDMTPEEYKSWYAETMASTDTWKRDRIFEHNEKLEVFAFIGGVAGSFISLSSTGFVRIGTYADAIPHIGDAFFNNLWEKQFADKSEALAMLTERGGLCFLLDLMELMDLDERRPASAAAAAAAAAAPTTAASFSGVIALFDKAGAHLKYPKINLNCEGVPIRIFRNGIKSRNCGGLTIVSEDRNQYFGQIKPSGQLVGGRDLTPAITALLERLAADPAKVAAEYGLLSGNCCFCSRPLDDERSTAVGYGPICAKHYGLKWGDKENV